MHVDSDEYTQVLNPPFFKRSNTLSSNSLPEAILFRNNGSPTICRTFILGLRNSENRILLKGEVADPSNPPSGCYFHPRCPYSQEKCKTDEPKLLELGNGQIVSCHFSEELELKGVEIMTQQA